MMTAGPKKFSVQLAWDIPGTISGDLGLGTNIVKVSSFLEHKDRKALKIVETADGFAQVFPEHKYEIVEILQNVDHIIGMTGDGVNDAPAPKKADCEIAVFGATDAARSSADIVLTLPGLSVIIDAIKESRQIFQRMNNYSIYRIAETVRVLIFNDLVKLGAYRIFGHGWFGKKHLERVKAQIGDQRFLHK